MPNDLVDRYNARLPLLTHVAAAVASGIAEALADENISAPVRLRAISAEEFQTHLLNLDQELDDPLSELADQIIGTLSVSTMDLIQPIASLIGEELTIISSGWMDAPESASQRMELTCLVPPWAMPTGWSERRDVPRTLTIRIEAVSSLRLVDQEQLTAPSTRRATAPVALIMKGGGIKGLAYVGALEELEASYEFNWFIGTSAGAIAAVLLAAGYSPSELKEILETKNFKEFFDASWFAVPLNLLFHHGAYKAEAFTTWLDDLLAKKLGSHSRVRLSDLPYRATVYASSRNQSKIKFDSEENDADAAYAVRCSMSIPLVFTPQHEQGIRTFDGGIQNNFPVEVLLRDAPNTPFISLFLGPETYEPVKQRWVICDLISIWTEASDAEIVRQHHDCTLVIDPRPIGTLDFSLTQDERSYLVAAGQAAALAHLRPSSREYTAAVAERNRLKLAVTTARAAKRRRWRVIGAVLFTAVVAGFMMWRYWWR